MRLISSMMTLLEQAPSKMTTGRKSTSVWQSWMNEMDSVLLQDLVQDLVQDSGPWGEVKSPQPSVLQHPHSLH